MADYSSPTRPACHHCGRLMQRMEASDDAAGAVDAADPPKPNNAGKQIWMEDRGLKCIMCDGLLGEVKDTRPVYGGKRRRMRLCEECGAENHSIEVVTRAVEKKKPAAKRKK